jgi:hypothetical protein
MHTTSYRIRGMQKIVNIVHQHEAVFFQLQKSIVHARFHVA